MTELDVPLTLEDRVAVQDLVTRYNRAIDTGDGPGVASCFVPEGTFTGATGRYVGRRELEVLGTRIASAAVGLSPIMHWVANMVLTPSTEGLRLRAYGMVLSASGGSPRVHLMGHYDDRLVRLDGRWLFASRTFTAVGQ